MAEAVAVARPREEGPATRLVELLDARDLERATDLTVEMATEAVEWPEVGPKIKQWWVGQFRVRVGGEAAHDAEEVWLKAEADARARNEAEVLDVAPAAPEVGKAADAFVPQAVKSKPGPAERSWPEPPTAPDNAFGFERLTYPRGLLGHVVQYIVDTAALPDRRMALAGALSACAKGLDRKVIGPTGNSTILFVVLIAETGAGKQHILNCIRMMLRAIGEESAIVASGIASVQSIEEVLEGKKEAGGKPSALVVIDEFGGFLSRISSKGQTGNVAEIPTLLQTLWGWPPELEWQGSIKVGKAEPPKVYGPAFSIFGSSTERAFFMALKKKEVANGFVNRNLLFNAGRGAEERVKPKYDWLKCPEWLAKALKDAAGPSASVNNQRLAHLQDSKLVVLKDFRRIGWGAGAEELWMKFEKEIRGMPSVEDRELWIRAPEIAERIATVLAVYRGAARVAVEDLEWAIEVVRHSTQQLVRGLDKHMLEDFEQADLVERIREEFRRKEVLSVGQIRKLCERKTNDYRKIDQAIEHLVKCGDTVELDPSDGAGRPTKKWRWERSK